MPYFLNKPDKVTSAFLSGNRAKNGSLSTDGTVLSLYDNPIAKIVNGDLYVSTAGYYTMTTQERLNRIPGVKVVRKGGNWTLNGADWDGDWIKVGKVPTTEGRMGESRVRRIVRQIIKEEVKRALSKRLREGVGKYYISYYATVGEHGEAGTYSDFNTAVSAAISKKKQKNGEGESFMDGLEYLGVEGAQGAEEFAIIFITKEYVNKIRPNWFKDNSHYKTYLAAAKDSLRTGKVVKGTYSATTESAKPRLREAYGLHPDVLNQYLETALWSSNDESDESGGEPFDANYSTEDIAPESIAQAKKDIEKFIQMAEDEGVLNPYLDAFTGPSWGNLGHDFWLTRNHHGAGFWDRSEIDDEVGKKLTNISQKFREVTPMLGDDGKIYFE